MKITKNQQNHDYKCLILLSILICLATATIQVHSCSVPIGWKPKNIEERVSQAEMVLHVRIAKSPTKWVVSNIQVDGKRVAKFVRTKDLYTAAVEIYCIYKGDSLER